MKTSRIKQRVIQLILLVLVGVFPLCGVASANTNTANAQGQIEFRPGYTWLSEDSGNMEGIALGVTGGWRFYDSLSLKLDLDMGLFDTKKSEAMRLIQPAIGLNYDIDRSFITPTIGTGIGPLFRQYQHDAWTTDAAWHVMGSIVFHLTPDVALGLEARYHILLMNFNQTPLYATLGLRLLILL